MDGDGNGGPLPSPAAIQEKAEEAKGKKEPLWGVLWGKWKKMKLASKMLLVTATLESLTVIIIGIITIVVPGRKDCFSGTTVVACSKDFLVNQSITLFAWSIFFWMEVFDGVFFENVIELYAAMFQACCVTAWSIWKFVAPYTNTYLDYLYLIAACSSQLIYLILSPFLYSDYEWAVWRVAGAEIKDQGMYRKYLLWLSLLKLDTAFGVFCTLLNGRGVFKETWFLIIDYVMLGICIIFMAWGWFVVKKEIRAWTIVWFFLFPLLPAYVIGFWVKQFTYNTNDPNAEYTSKTMGTLFTVCGVISLLARTGLIITTKTVFQNFGKGILDFSARNEESLRETYDIEEEDPDFIIFQEKGDEYEEDVDLKIKLQQSLRSNSIKSSKHKIEKLQQL